MTLNDDEHRELRTLLLLLAVAVGLLTTGAVVWLTFAYPRLTEPLAVGAAVLTCLAGLARLVVNAAERRRRQ
jgi:glucan phosphoethanolaminetransferase (alkaline phosphatase superfamily)